MKEINKIKGLITLFIICVSIAFPTFAAENESLGVYVNTEYYNPDTGEIDDGGTANAALGVGMCRSATDERGLVEKIGDEYYVTIRLLLQSNTKDAKFWKRIGDNKYEQVTYEIMSENGVEDSVDYRFKVDDPWQPIKASMYVTPMGRDTLWYIRLDKSSSSEDTFDFVVTAPVADKESEKPPVKEETNKNKTEVKDNNKPVTSETAKPKATAKAEKEIPKEEKDNKAEVVATTSPEKQEKDKEQDKEEKEEKEQEKQKEKQKEENNQEKQKADEVISTEKTDTKELDKKDKQNTQDDVNKESVNKKTENEDQENSNKEDNSKLDNETYEEKVIEEETNSNNNVIRLIAVAVVAVVIIIGMKIWKKRK